MQKRNSNAELHGFDEIILNKSGEFQHHRAERKSMELERTAAAKIMELHRVFPCVMVTGAQQQPEAGRFKRSSYHTHCTGGANTTGNCLMHSNGSTATGERALRLPHLHDIKHPETGKSTRVSNSCTCALQENLPALA